MNLPGPSSGQQDAAKSEKPVLKPFRRHILMCTGPRCAPEISPEVYQYLKDQLKKLNLHEGPDRINRSQCHCFGICQGGPLAVVYPDNIWYHHLTKEKVDRIIQEHFLKNQPVKDCVFYFQSDSLKKS